MFESEKSDWKDGRVEGSEEERDRREETRVGDDERTVDGGSAGVAEALCLF